MEISRRSPDNSTPATLDAIQFSARTQLRDVTLLFADLRESSRITTSLDSDRMFRLLAQVMDCLTAAVIEHNGLVIDYYGDGLAAMWNAPTDQPEHAELACRAALRMLETIPEIATAWADSLEGDLRLGVGLHSGAVQVGNVGSRQRVKYGPRGPNVNLASRVEAATKLIGLPLLVTGSVVAQLSSRLLTYRVCRAEFPGIRSPIDLFNIMTPSADAATRAAIAAYDKALKLFEQGDLDQANDELRGINRDSAAVPAAFLAEQIEHATGTRKRRRSTDESTHSAAGVVKLRVK